MVLARESRLVGWITGMWMGIETEVVAHRHAREMATSLASLLIIRVFGAGF